MTSPRGPCDPGYLCYNGSYTSQPDKNIDPPNREGDPIGEICPTGFYCTEGALDKTACPNGKFNPQQGAYNADGCIDCSAGKFCDGSQTTGDGDDCPAGSFCVAGTSIPEVCDAGTYCPVRSAAPNDCPQGTYQDSNNSDLCLPCQAGKVCTTVGLTSPDGDCQPGFYCPVYSASSPVGSELDTYNFHKDTFIGITNNSDFGTFSTTGIACPAGTYQPNSNAQDASSCLPCPVGKYCESAGAASDSGDCLKGYICIEGSIRNNPYNSSTDGSTGYICPAGHYCDQSINQTHPIECPLGTYRSTLMGAKLDDCRPCPPGYFCDSLAKTSIDFTNDLCEEGFFCPEGSSDGQNVNNQCQIGQYCPAGSANSAICPDGTYQDQVGQSSCNPCDTGKLCINDNSCSTSGNCMVDCPAGYYCLNGYKKACPPGTYSDAINLSDINQCVACPSGKYCDGIDPTALPKNISAGFFSDRGAKTAKPSGVTDCNPCVNNVVLGDFPASPSSCTICDGINCNSCGICPEGQFCTEMSITSQNCPSGTYGEKTGLENDSECSPCPPGKSCGIGSTKDTYETCDAGYLCLGGCDSKTPTSGCGQKCAANTYCPAGALQEINCPDGTQSDEGSATCEPCQDGKVCLSGQPITDCGPGFYCTAGVKYPCPPETYSTNLTAVSVNDCQSCPEGEFCGPHSAFQMPNNCPAGYYCEESQKFGQENICPKGYCCDVNTITPELCPAGKFCSITGLSCVEVNSTDSYNCPAGYYCPKTNSPLLAPLNCPSGSYCPEKVDSPINCAAGTFNPYQNAIDISWCQPCPPGKYCESNSSDQITDLSNCDDGYYCPGAAQNSKGKTDSVSELLCDLGHFCISGQQNICPPGTFQDQTGQISCQNCLGGTYCPIFGMTTPRDCEPGFYCPGGIKREPCPSGTFNDLPNQDQFTDCQNCPIGTYSYPHAQITCSNCTAGFYCGIAGSDTPTAQPCSTGHYCPEGTTIERPCPAGTYSDVVPTTIGLLSDDQCFVCPVGKFCDGTSPSSPVDCPGGKFCDIGSTNSSTICPLRYYCETGQDKALCPSGTYAENDGLELPEPDNNNPLTPSCSLCDHGKYCNKYGLIKNEVDTSEYDCPAGYYCLSKSGRGSCGDTILPECNSDDGIGCCSCPTNHYCPANVDAPQDCDPGFYVPVNTENNIVCQPCPAGSYCDDGQIVAPCEQGYFCPGQNDGNYKANDTYKCPIGTYSTSIQATSIDICQACTAGYACSTIAMSSRPGVSDKCEAGFYCPSGSNSTQANVCPEGYRCPTGIGKPIACEPGFYQPNTQQTTCETCLQGFYCPFYGMTSSDLQECPIGSYCLSGSSIRKACPTGTFGNETQQISKNAACHNCLEGYYCDSEGLTESNMKASNICNEGYYCPSGTKSQTAHPCEAGSFCPAGSINPSNCPENYYCGPNNPLTFDPTTNDKFKCQAGCMCAENSKISCPVKCDAGYYCEEGMSKQACPVGTYRTKTGAQKLSDCVACDEGYYCNSTAMANLPSLICKEGYYCESGSITETGHKNGDATDKECPVGYKCPEGTSSYYLTPCHGGFYQDETKQDSCKPCVAGFYCPFSDSVNNPITSMIPVDHGYYTDNQAAVQSRCPVTTYSEIQGQACQPCPAGKFCDQPGMISVSSSDKDCNAGYYCSLSSDTPSPSEVANSDTNSTLWGNGPCPPGHYCESGVITPEPCPIGTYRPSTMGMNVDDCIPCSAGATCTETGMTQDGTGCPLGKSCEAGGQQDCLRGYYCDGLTAYKQPCPLGTYNDILGANSSSLCLNCPAGKYCDQTATVTPLSCTQGHYCPENSEVQTVCPFGLYKCDQSDLKCPIQCPSGEYSDDAINCKACPIGFTCIPSITYDFSTNCTEYFNLGSPESITPCPTGHYCDGSETQTPCPKGTFNSVVGLSSVNDCQACTPGYNCNSTGIESLATVDTYECPPGFFCPLGTGSDSQPPQICDTGAYCPGNVERPILCSLGTYNDEQGKQFCKDCPAGKFCNTTGLTTDDDAPLCPVGFYCELGTPRPEPCPAGTLRDTPGAENVSQCNNCTLGSFCESASSSATGLCLDGFYCDGQAKSPDQTICPSGSVCDCGASKCSEPQDCPQGQACPFTGMTNSEAAENVCNDGYYCDRKSNSQIPVDDVDSNYGPCPAGNYCASGLKNQCPAGTFFHGLGISLQSECFDCTEGKYCQGTGNTEPTDVCDDGYYCTGQSSSATEADCPIGFQCLQGIKIPCGFGDFQGSSGVNPSCQTCTSGKTCTLTDISVGLTAPSDDCPLGGYCLGGNSQYTYSQCPPGTYNDVIGKSSLSDCQDCQPGYGCPNYGMINSTDFPCSAGYYCQSGSNSPYPTKTDEYDPTGVTLTNGPCPPGHYCESNSINPEGCPRGTYREEMFGAKTTDCTDCPAGYFCNVTGLVTFTNSELCPAGFYCPGGNQKFSCPEGTYCEIGQNLPLYCPPGTYQDQIEQISINNCLTCPSRYYCPLATGILNDTLLCPDGYYCNGGITSKYDNPCEIGFQCNNGTGTSGGDPCPSGFYTDLPGQSYCQPCESGFYCAFDSNLGTTKKLICPEGFYCSNSTVPNDTPTPCPKGTYGTNPQLLNENECQACPPGKFCDETGLILTDLTNRDVAPGYYCQEGCLSATPNSLTNNTDICDTNSNQRCFGDPCPVGFKCPGGTSRPVNCLDGFYQDSPGQDSCIQCEAGFYCSVDNDNPNLGTVKLPCPTGHFCPVGTSRYTTQMCPSGTYNPNLQGQNINNCQSCDAGKYCNGIGLSAPSGDCYKGYHCGSGSETPAPSSERCNAGTYCPDGLNQIDCDEKMACTTDGLARPDANCTAGYYCPTGSISPNQNPCQSGFYCPPRSSVMMPCPPGTFGSNTLAAEITDCIDCPPGEFCSQSGLPTFETPCQAGYFCDLKAQNSTQNRCPVGHYCPENSGQPIKCVAGTYQNQTTQVTCVNCPSGFTCQEGQINPEVCPIGFYCPSGTEKTSEILCANGSFGGSTGLSSQSDCSPCPEFNYCNNGLNQGFCAPGYYCEANSSNEFEFPCPLGFYCENGQKFACPDGTYSLNKLAKNTGECQNCQAGKFCVSGTQNACLAGSMCYSGSSTPTPDGSNPMIGEPCPVGYYCPQGTVNNPTVVALACNTGAYQPSPGQSNCIVCPAGSYCPPIAQGISEVITTYPCPKGYYCPDGTINKFSNPCAPGTYNEQESQTDISACVNCPDSYGCDSYGIWDLDQLTSLGDSRYNCMAGYYCQAGSTTRTENECPAGFYCPEKSAAPVPCDPGTYSDKITLQRPEDCQICDAGYYCVGGESSPSGQCDAGTICRGNTTNINSTGDDCPAGYCCSKGAAIPSPCDEHSYNNITGIVPCLGNNDGSCPSKCPAGFYCPFKTIVPLQCEPGNYCPEGQGLITCPDGTYSNTVGAIDISTCLTCPPGKWCEEGKIIDTCDAGYICLGGDSNARPSNNVADLATNSSGICPIGYYCTEGSLVPQICTNNTVITYLGAMSADECVPCPNGYICTSGLPELCPPGRYCQQGNTYKCPEGFYQPGQQKVYLSDCVICLAGYNCDYQAISTLNSTLYCPAGQYCLEGTGMFETLVNGTLSQRLPINCPSGTYNSKERIGSITGCLDCPAGQYCLEGSVEGTDCAPEIEVNGTLYASYCPTGMSVTEPDLNTLICPAGWYCGIYDKNDDIYSPDPSVKIMCPAGFYCPSGSFQPIACPEGFYCPLEIDEATSQTIAGASYPVLCPLGTIILEEPRQTSIADTCQICSAGFYGNQNRTQCLECSAGVYCQAGAYTTIPPSDPNLYDLTIPCPIGYYCEQATPKPTACPVGTYNGLIYGKSIDNCNPCPLNEYNNKVGQSECKICGAQATQPNRGSTTCECNGNGRNFQPSDNQCPCAVGYETQNDICVKKVYPLCSDGTTRTQFGECFTNSQWETYCTSVCGAENYEGFNRVVGTCICQTPELDTICDLSCREAQQKLIRLECPSSDDFDNDSTATPQIVVRDENGNIVESYDVYELSLISNGVSAFTQSCENQLNALNARSLDTITNQAVDIPIFIMDATTDSISGVYNPDPTVLTDVLDTVVSNNSSNLLTRKKRQISLIGGPTAPADSFADNREDQIMESPVICAELGSIFMWSLENGVYPKYDVNNLFNDNFDFDYGGFRALETQQMQSTSPATVFAYEFAQEGSFAFYLVDPSTVDSTTQPQYYIYVKITGENITCPDLGPYFAPTENNFARSGISIDSDIVQEADWSIITWVAVGFILSIIWAIAAMFLFKKYGWDKMNKKATYRKLTLAADLSQYASKGSSYDFNLENTTKKLNNKKLSIIANHSDLLENPEYWNYGRQVDLDGFSSKQVFFIMEEQADKLGAEVAKQNQEVSGLYRKIALESAAIKDVVAHRLGFDDRSQLLTKSEKRECIKNKKKQEQEVYRRRKIAQKALEFYKSLLVKKQSNLQDFISYLAAMQGSIQEMVSIFIQLDHLQASNFTDQAEQDEYRSNKMHRVGELHIDMTRMRYEHQKTIDNSRAKETGTESFLDCARDYPRKISNAINHNCLNLIEKPKNCPKLKYKVELSNKFKANNNIVCPETGLTTHILAATIEENENGKNEFVPLGGIHHSVFTNLRAPVEYLGLCSTLQGDGTVTDTDIGVVLGLGLDSEGQTYPIYTSDLNADNIPNTLIEQSMLTYLNSKYQYLLDKIQIFMESSEPFSQSPVYQSIKHVTEEITLTLTEINHVKISEISEIKKHLDTMSHINLTGTVLGSYEDLETGVKYACIPGMEIADPAGSSLDVPILAAIKQPATGKNRILCRPIAGSMKIDTGELRAIILGNSSIDPETGNKGFVIGGRLDRKSDMIIPVVTKETVKNRPSYGSATSRQIQKELEYRQDFIESFALREKNISSLVMSFTQNLMHYLKILGDHQITDVTPVEENFNLLVQPIDNYLKEFQELFDKEQTRRKNDLASIAELIREDLGNVAIIDPLNELTEYDLQESQAILALIDALSKMQEATEYAKKTVCSQGDSIRNLYAEMQLIANKTTSKIMSCLAVCKIIRRIVKQSGEIALSDLSGENWVATELEWRELLVPQIEDTDIPIEDLMKDLIQKLKNESRYYLAPDALKLVDTTVELPKTQQQIEKEKQEKIQKEQEAQKEKNRANKLAATRNGSIITDPVSGADNIVNEEQVEKEVENLLSSTQLQTKIASEAAVFARTLKGIQIDALKDCLATYDNNKKQALAKQKQNLVEELSNCKSDTEKAKILEKYSEEMALRSKQIDDRKKAELSNLIDKISKEEKDQKQAFYNKKRQEALSHGIDPMEIIPNIDFDTDEYEQKLTNDLEKLALELQKLGADIAQDWPPKQMSEELLQKMNDEMQAKINAINALRPNMVNDENHIKNLTKIADQNFDEIKNYVRQRTNLQSKLRNKMKKRVRQEIDEIVADDPIMNSDQKATESLVIESNNQAVINTIMEALDADKSNEISDVLKKKLLSNPQFLKEKTGDQDYLNELLERYNNSCGQLEKLENDRKQTYKSRLQERLAARTKLMKNNLTDNAADKDLSKFGISNQNLHNNDDNNSPEYLENQQKRQEIDDSITRNQIRQLDNLEKHHDDEQKRLEQQLKSESLEKNMKLDIDFSDRLEKRNIEIDLQLQNSIDRAGNNTDEVNKLIEQANADKEKFRTAMNAQRAKQMEMLERARRQRRDRKVKLLQEQQKLESAQVLKKLSEERFIEKEKLEAHMLVPESSTTNDNKNDALQKLLQKQAREIDRAAKQKDEDMAIALHKAQQNMRLKRENLRDDILANFAEEENEVLSSNSSLEDLNSRKLQKLSAFDQETQDLIEKITVDPRIELEHASKILTLREKHLQELANAIRISSGLKGKLIAEAAKQAEEAAKLKRAERIEIITRADLAIDQAKKAKREVQEELQRTRDAEIEKRQAELERKIEREKQKELEKLSRKLDARNKTGDDKMKNEVDEIHNKFAGGHITNDEKERLLKESVETEKQRQIQLKNEKDKMKKHLVAKLEARKKKRAEFLKKEIINNHEVEQLQQGEMNKALDKEIAMDLIDKLSKADPFMLQKAGTLKLPDLSSLEKDLRNLLEIHQNKLDQASQAQSEIVSSLQAVPGLQLVLLDHMDKQWTLEGKLTPINRLDLSTQQLLAWRYAQFSANNIAKILHLKYQIKIKAAKTLPNNNYINNAFRNSFYYNQDTLELFIRDKRFNQPSELLVIVAHCMSHITNKDDFDDTNGDFIRNLYFALKLLSSDHFSLMAQPSVLIPSVAEQSEEIVDSVLDLKFRLNDQSSTVKNKKEDNKKKKTEVFEQQNKTIVDDFNQKDKDFDSNEIFNNYKQKLNQIMKDIDSVSQLIEEQSRKATEQNQEIQLRLQLKELLETRAKVIVEMENV